MGLTHSSVGHRALSDGKACRHLKYTVALAGNPNVGKSSIFNALTGLNQHTGNWTGKTVSTAVGNASKEDITFVDLPGTYSLHVHSPEEEVARSFIESGKADVTVVVCDALCLERTLALAVQITELTSKIVVCVNFMDTAKRRGITVDTKLMSKQLGLPVIGVSARNGNGLDNLCAAIRDIAENRQDVKPLTVYTEDTENELKRLTEIGCTRAQVINSWICGDMTPDIREAFTKLAGNDPHKFTEMLLSRPIIIAEGIAAEVISVKERCGYSKFDRKLDSVITHPIASVPIMLLMLLGIFWLTIVGSNYPSALLMQLFENIESGLYSAASALPPQIRDMLILGVLGTLFRVVSVMLPPMAIFFPLFTLMEDFGLLGRIAFNLDGAFCRAGTCGKQALTM